MPFNQVLNTYRAIDMALSNRELDLQDHLATRIKKIIAIYCFFGFPTHAERDKMRDLLGPVSPLQLSIFLGQSQTAYM
jgi:hypothetical protein